MQSSKRETTLFNVHTSHYLRICVFSVCLSSETNTMIEKIDSIDWIPFARATREIANAACRDVEDRHG